MPKVLVVDDSLSVRKVVQRALESRRIEVLSAAFDTGGAERVTRLYRRDDLPEDQCWVRAPGWCLAYR